MAARLNLIGLVCVLSALLAGCALDKEADLRRHLSGWIFVAQTRYFTSKMVCTVAVFDLARSEISSKVSRATSIDTALIRVHKGIPVLFDIPDISPNSISEQLMSRDLGKGLGMLSTGVGPAKDCMDDDVAAAYFAVLMSPETRTVYDPAGDALLMVYPPENLAFFLRGNV
ncbi:MAG: hypothetical protein ACRBB0_12505 [Pelagimonas sp.]|uniref:hypothetical protein n=1 Tax=Pelagimonas sp. TaxID=2073170 RepID=UPI003D6B6B3A